MLQALYPEARGLFDHIRGLDILSLEAEELLRQTCCFNQTEAVKDVSAVLLPEDIQN